MTIERSFKEDFGSFFLKGISISVLQFPFVGFFNGVSKNASFKRVGGMLAIHSMLKGENGGVSGALAGYFRKEAVRLSFKPLGAVCKVKIDKEFSRESLKASLLFASLMGSMELGIHPLSVLFRSVILNEKLNRRGLLYRNTMKSGVKQFSFWSVVAFSGSQLDVAFSRYPSLNTKEYRGMALKSGMQATILTILTYPFFERLRNEMSYFPHLFKEKAPYLAAFDHVIKRSGWVGFSHGMIVRIFSHSILTSGFNLLVESGRR
jgi:hypothetical protein